MASTHGDANYPTEYRAEIEHLIEEWRSAAWEKAQGQS